jgi:hypothetical protein
MSKLILVGSGLATLITWLVIINRRTYFHKVIVKNREFAPRAAKLLKLGAVADCTKLASKFGLSHLAAIMEAGLNAMQTSLGREPNTDVIKKVERAMDRAKQLALAKLRGRLVYLETIGAISPILALIDSRQAALFFALTTTAPAIGFGILFRNRLAAFETEINVVASETLDYVESTLSSTKGT